MRRTSWIAGAIAVLTLVGYGGRGGGGGGSSGTTPTTPEEAARTCTEEGMEKLFGLMDQTMRFVLGVIDPIPGVLADLAGEGIIYAPASGAFSFPVDLNNDGTMDATVEGSLSPINSPAPTDLTDGFENWETGFTMAYTISDNDSTLGEGVLSFVNLERPTGIFWKVGIVVMNPYFVQEAPCSTIEFSSFALHTEAAWCFTEWVTTAMFEYTLDILGDPVLFLAVIDPESYQATVSGTYGGILLSFTEDLSDDIPVCTPP